MSLPCPMCGHYLRYDPNTGQYYCPHCGWREYGLEVKPEEEDDD